MLIKKTILTLLCALLFSTISSATEINETSTIEEIKTALNTGRSTNIRGTEYIWEEGVIYKIKSGKKRRTRGLKDIVKASVSPVISTTIPMPKNCEKPNYQQEHALKLIQKAIALFPSARYEYVIQTNNTIDKACLTAATAALIQQLTNSDQTIHLEKSNILPRPTVITNDHQGLLLQILRVK